MPVVDRAIIRLLRSEGEPLAEELTLQKQVSLLSEILPECNNESLVFLLSFGLVRATKHSVGDNHPVE